MDLLFLSKRIYLGTEEGFLNGGVVVDTEGIIRRVLRSTQELNTYLYNTESEAVYDFEDMVLMPGLIDTNVHINEPGRADWEGFAAATKAAAAGGFTVIIDRPTNAIPCTTSVASLETKTAAARGKIFIDVGFWGGLVPNNIKELNDLSAAGVMGLQCTLCPSPDPVANEFPAVTREQLITALNSVEKGTLIAFHAELGSPTSAPSAGADEERSKRYDAYLQTRPAQLEVNAVELIAELALQFKDKRFHIMNASAKETLTTIAECKRSGGMLTAATCPHYLTLSADEIADYRTESKTRPPIRCKTNQRGLWEGLKCGELDIIASDHSPTTPGLKCQTYGSSRGDFLRAWPGISSLQIAFPVIWTALAAQGLGLQHLHEYMCERPARLCNMQHFKGKIEEGFDADFCIFDPDEEFTVSPEILYSKNKITPYNNRKLKGVVHATVVRGIHVYQKYEGFGQPLGKVILRKTVNEVVRFLRV